MGHTRPSKLHSMYCNVKQKLIAMDVADSEVSLAKQVKELDSILHEIIANEKSEELLSRYEGY